MLPWILCALTAQQPTPFQAATSEVLVDVVVRDRRGRLVRGLAASDFRVAENGQPQTVTLFREVRSSPSSPPVITPGERPEQAREPGSPAPALRLERQARLVSLVFERLGPEGRRLSRQAAQDFLAQDLGSNVFYAVFSIDRGFRVIQPYTNDRTRLAAAIQTATSGERADFANNTQSLGRVQEVTASAVGAAAAVSAGPVNSAVNGSALSAEQANRMARQMTEFADTVAREDFGRVSVFSLWAIVRELAPLPGRKSVLYFSEQFELPNGLWQQFRSLLSAANRANVSVYSIDARGLQAGGDAERGKALLATATQRSGAYTRNTQTIQDDGRDEFRTFDTAMDSIKASTQNVLAELAESTGGFLIANTNDFRKPLARLSDDFNTYYELTYRPASVDYDGRFRAITVTVAGHEDYQVQARNGYFALPPLEGQAVFPYEVPLLRALGESPLPRDVDFRANVVQFRQREGQQQALLVFDLPLSKVTFARDEKNRKSRSHLSVLSLIKSADGQVLAKLSRDVPLEQPLDRLEGFRQGRFIVTKPLKLWPGRYTIESAVMDREGRRLAARKVALVVPRRSDGMNLSEIMLLRRLDKLPETIDPLDPTILPQARAIPTLADTLPSGARSLTALVTIYSASGQPPRFIVDLWRDGQLVSRSAPPLPPPDADGVIPHVMNLPLEGLAPGNYELRATAVDETKGIERSLFVTIER